MSLSLTFASSAYGQEGIGDDALPGLLRTDTADELPAGALFAVTSGYGFTGSTLDQSDSHHRGAGRLNASYRLVKDLAIAVRFDGRYDKHFGASGKDDGWVGDPRFLARYRRTLTSGLSTGVQVGLWAPGSEAPSIEFAALSMESSLALSYALPTRPLALAFNVGYRLDRSASSVAGDEALSLADRMSLGVSEYNAVLFALGASYRFGKVHAAAEWSLDLLHGKGAPPFRQSPMRVGTSMQLPLSDVLALTAQTEVRVSRVSALEVASSLLPFDPQVQTMIGLALRFGGASKVQALVVVEDHSSDLANKPLDKAPASTTLHGQVLTGEQGVADARVEIQAEGGKSHQLTTDESGSFSIELPLGAIALSIQADGFEPKREQVSLMLNADPIQIYLDAILPPGQLRGVVRSFRGRPLKAELRIEPGLKIVQTAADGSFEVDLPPGDYEVSISVGRFKPQMRQIRIEEDGVTIMNVDLRR